ncbi:MAG: histone H1 [Rhodobacteraceae bacterium]|nr:histone H1 [Paracoccaceae bacterium]
MPKGPQGQRRPSDVVGCAVAVAKIATGELDDTFGKPRQPNKAKGGRIGGKRRAESLTPERRSEIALAAASARWNE